MMTSEAQSHQRLGDFEIVREIGRGGMGIVYEARQVSLNRKVALKVLAGSLGLTSKAVVRFRREAEAAAKLHHTNIVPIYATGEEDGTHFYAMELVEGPSLNVVIKALREGATPASSEQAPGRAKSDEGGDAKSLSGAETQSTVTIPLPSWVAETIAGEATPTPASAFESTPSGSSTTLTTGGGYFDNVARMMAEVAEGLDYAHNQGVIHRDIKPSNLLLSPAGRLSINDFGLARMLEQPGMTMTGEFMGTPMFMSPEQIAVGRAPLDHRTDIYSLGATLYELLTLEPPFPGERRDQIIAQILHKEPKSPRRHNKRIPVDLETVCLKAMEKDPDRRYQTAGQMAEDLRRFVNLFAISAKRAGPLTQMTKWIRRRPAVAGLLALVIVISAAAGLVGYRSHLIAVNARIAEGQRALEHALIEAMSGRYDEVEPWLERAEVLDVDPGQIRVMRGLAAVERADMERAVHELELAVEQLPQSLGARALLRRAYREAGQLDNALATRQTLKELKPHTPVDYLYGAWAVWIENPELAREWCEYLVSEHPTPAAYFVSGLRLTLDLMGTFDPREIDHTIAHVSAAWTQMPDNCRAGMIYVLAHLAAADIHGFHGAAFDRQSNLEKARDTARQMLAKHPDDGNAHAAAAWVALAEERWEDAVEHLRTAIDKPGFWAPARFFLPAVLYRLGRYEEALSALEVMPAGLRAQDDWPWFCVLLTAELQGTEAAERAYLEWREEHRELPSRALYAPIFEVYCLLGRPDEARRAIREHIREYGPPPAYSPFDRALHQYHLGELAEDALLAAAATRTERLDARYCVGLSRLAKGDRKAAVEQFSANARCGELTGGYNRYGPLLRRLQQDPTWPPWIPVKEEDAKTRSPGESIGRDPGDEETP